MSQLLDLAVVIPTFNERRNVPVLIAKLDQALAGMNWEAIFVDDDSPDGTADAARELARVDRRVRVIQRIGRRGLSTACIEGMCATAAPLVAVIDGDLQHDETILPAMAKAFVDPSIDVAIGSRFVAGGGTGDWDTDRVAKSALATKLSRHVLKADLSDPMSGFFMIRSQVARELAPRLAGIGFKILLDIMTASPRPLKFIELPYTFRVRTEGESKLDYVVAMEYLIAIYDRMFGRVIPVRFAMFSAIGAIGVGVHMAVLWPIVQLWGDDAFLTGQIVAAIVAMTANFFLNNALTYRDRRLKGVRQLFDGWVSFCLVCSVGLVANVGLAGFLHDFHYSGWALSALVGVLIGAVWNYALSSKFVWGRY